MTQAPKPLGRLTRHQREVYDQLERLSVRRDGLKWVPFRNIGSRGALSHLVEKGWALERMDYGPRGGERPEFRPSAAALQKTSQ